MSETKLLEVQSFFDREGAKPPAIKKNRVNFSGETKWNEAFRDVFFSEHVKINFDESNLFIVIVCVL